MEAELRGDSDEDEWNEKVGPDGLADLKAMLRLANGHSKKFAFLNAPLLSAKEVASEYLALLDYDSDEDLGGFNHDETLQEVCMHEFWIPFACYPAEIAFLIDFDPGPAGQRGQVLANYNYEERFVVCASLTELFTLVNQGLRNKAIKFGPVEDYEQEYDLLTPDGEQANIVEILDELRGT